ncbi:LysM peptidoglycan-binding domain-containing protein [Leucobacter coleopterorum]|nr:LysM peptidoglycan-binding domain-containing protein [Leucobacter coleopterorum]
MSARTVAGQAGTRMNDANDAYAVEARDTARLRLTRRGRVVVGGLIALVLAGLLVFAATLLSPQAFATDSASNKQQFHYVVAQPGESLWSLASELDPKVDPRDLIAEIVQLNQLRGSNVEAGQALAVPLRYSDNKNVISANELEADSAA